MKTLNLLGELLLMYVVARLCSALYIMTGLRKLTLSSNLIQPNCLKSSFDGVPMSLSRITVTAKKALRFVKSMCVIKVLENHYYLLQYLIWAVEVICNNIVLISLKGVRWWQYHNVPKFSDRQVWANSADPDRLLLEEQSDQGLHYLQFPLHLLDALL